MSRNHQDEVEIALSKLIADRIKIARTERKVSQAQIGDVLGVAFQQIGKFERGENRVTAAQLFIIAQFLSVEISFFFNELPNISFKPSLVQRSPNDE